MAEPDISILQPEAQGTIVPGGSLEPQREIGMPKPVPLVEVEPVNRAETPTKEPRKSYWIRHLKRLAWAVVVLAVVCGLVFMYTRWRDPDRDFKLVNFAAAWFPFAIGVLAVFVPDLEKFERMRMRWRVAVLIVSFAYSGLLWFQQGVNLKASRSDQREAVNTAIDKANIHTDKAVDGVKQDLGTVRDDLRGKITETNGKIVELSSDLRKGNETLGESIGKVGKPDPPVPAKLQFSLWDDTKPPPILFTQLRPDKDWIVPVEVFFLNASPTAAHSIDMWIDVCLVCSFNKEPLGFDRPAGMPDTTRHMAWPLLNPRAATPKQPIEIKIKDPGIPIFPIQFRYSCELCGTPSAQQVQIILLPPTPISQ